MGKTRTLNCTINHSSYLKVLDIYFPFPSSACLKLFSLILSILLGIKFSSEKLYCMAAYLQVRGIASVGKRFVSQISYAGTPNPSLSSSFSLRYLINYWYYIYTYSVRSSCFGGVIVIVAVFSVTFM